MKALIQRTTCASVSVANQDIGNIDKGIVVLLGIENSDSVITTNKCIEKILAYRIFNDNDGKMNLSAHDIGADLLIISQFTLAAQTNKGLRPGFSSAAPPQTAEVLYNYFVEQAQRLTQNTQSKIATGRFGADMQVSLVNDGPVTFLLTFD